MANIGPADYNYDESISTLRYANRAKNIKNRAKINEDPKDALLRQFQKEIEELRKQLEDGEDLSASLKFKGNVTVQYFLVFSQIFTCSSVEYLEVENNISPCSYDRFE